MYAFFVSFLLFSRRLPKPSKLLALWSIAIGLAIVGVIYASIIFRALNERSHDPHVHKSRRY